MTANRLTQRHRAQQLLIRQDTEVKVERLWPNLRYEDLDSTFPALAVAVAAVVTANRLTSAGVAARYLRLMRSAAGLRGATSTVVVKKLSVEQFTTAMRVTSLVAVKRATVEGIPAEVAMRDALVQTTGSASRLVLNAGRETVRQTSLADPDCEGWVRVGRGECDWCRQYLDGEVHRVEGYDFAAHDHCNCTAEPVYG